MSGMLPSFSESGCTIDRIIDQVRKKQKPIRDKSPIDKLQTKQKVKEKQCVLPAVAKRGR